jgi:acyl dehydratase
MEGPVRMMSAAALSARVGSELGTSRWIRIDQSMVDLFADLTSDRYFIHVDPKRAASTRFGGTIAHGFLTLSMLSTMAYEACPGVEGTKTAVNYGFNRLRFVAPVPTGSNIRGRFVLKSFDVQPAGRWQSIYDVTVEIEGEGKPALAAEWIAAGFL